MAELGAAQQRLCHLDTLPGHCSLAIECDFTGHTPGGPRVRFQAIKHHRLRKDEYSEWSGWFKYNGEPIELQWKTFWL